MAEDIRIVREAPISAVTVHREGATITRELSLEPGDGWPAGVAVVGLPLAIRAATVRVSVSVEGPGGALAGDPRLGVWARPPEETVDPPEQAEVWAAERAVQRIEQRIAALDAELGVLGALDIEPRPTPPQGKAPPPSPMAARLALVAFSDALTEERHGERAEAEAAAIEARAALASARDRAARASSARVIDAAAITGRVDVPLILDGSPTAVRLTLSYFVPGARWVPAWQVRLTGDGAAATVEMRAHVVQRSGEDWSGVKLRLSTAEPLRFSALPELDSIRIGKAQDSPPATRGFRPPPAGAGALFGDFDRARSLLGPRAPGASALPAPAAPEMPPWPAWMFEPRREVAALEGYGEVDEMPMEFAEAEPMAAGGPPLPPVMERAAMAPPPAPRAPAPAADMRRKRSASRGAPAPKGGFGGAAPGGPPQAVQAAVLFAELRLPPPDSGARGKLMPADRRAQWRDALSADGRALDVDPDALARRAEQLARSVSGAAAPSGTTAVGGGRFDYAWVTDSPVDVPADGGWHSVPVRARTLPCALRYVTVPREAPHVFRLATLHNDDRAPLLAGPAELYVDGAYVLSTTLGHVPAGGRFELGLGVEQAIRCARNARYDEARSDARVVAMAELRHHIAIELKNGLRRPADVEVRERVPQPAEGAEVVVEEQGVRPPWEPYDQTDRGRPVVGGRRWRLTVAPGATAALDATYVVKIYAANELVGGNRREA